MNSFDDFREVIKADEPMAPHVWFRLGGPAAFLAKPGTLEELLGLVKRCRDAGLPWKVLSGGSNVLVRDEGVNALVLHLESPAFADVRVEGRVVTVGAAVPLTALISQSARAGLAGLESLTGIPGTVGGALRTNAGNRQAVIGQYVRSATVVDAADEVRVRDRDDLNLADRGSNFDDPLILSAEFELEHDEPEAVVKRMRRIWIVKKEGQPYGHQSSGYIFKNFNPDLSAATLIEQAGLKGARQGGAEVSERNANFIVAQPGARADDVLRLIDHVRQQVRKQFGYELETQIQVW